MMKTEFSQLSRRLSVRKYDGALRLFQEELDGILRFTESTERLFPEIKTRAVVVPRKETTAKFGVYSLLLYSEKKPGWLVNAGYLLEQTDLYMASRNIGACWYGMGKPKGDAPEGMEYVIMLVFGAARPEQFRTDITQFQRRALKELFTGDYDPEAASAVRLAPSACNSQPWQYEWSGDRLTMRRTAPKSLFVPAGQLRYFNQIDQGIGICFLETALVEKGYAFQRTLFPEGESSPVTAEYLLQQR